MDNSDGQRKQLIDEREALRCRVAELEGEKERRNRDLEAQERLLAAFHQVGQVVLETLDLDEILDRLATQIIEAGLFRSLMIALVREEERIVEVTRNYVCYTGTWQDAQMTPGQSTQVSDHVVLMRDGCNVATRKKITGTVYSLDDDNITPTVARTGRLEVIEEWSEKFDQNAGDPEGRRGKVAYFIPVKKGGRVLAVLATDSEVAEKEEILRRIETMQPLLDYVAIALDHARLYGRLRREMDERRQMEQELVRLERLRAVGELSAGISHNLNNILTGVLGPAQLLKRLSDDVEVLREADEIITSAGRARDLVHQLHLSVRSAEEELRPVPVEEVVREAVQATRPRWKDEPEAKGIVVEMVTRLEETVPARGTSTGLYDVLSNLILNAVDAMPEGGTIRISTCMAGEEVRVEVTDTGVGMDVETRRRVFEPFFTTKMDVGTGLGLSMAYRTVHGWGGDIRVESAPGQGTTFTLVLPVWEEEEEAATQQAPRRGRVLLAEDDERLRTALIRILGEKHEIEIAEDGRQALAVFAPGQFDAALIDLGLPGMPGDQVARQMRQLDPAVATVLATGWILDPDDPRLAVFDFWLQKPFFNLDQVEQTVARAVELAASRR